MVDVWQALLDMMALNEIHNFFDKIGGSFWGDFWSNTLGAVISGGIILMISTRISKEISKKESDNNMESMIEGIKYESEQNLKLQRTLYIEKLELEDMLLIEGLLTEIENKFKRLMIISIPVMLEVSETEKTIEKPQEQFELLEVIYELTTPLLVDSTKVTVLMLQHKSIFNGNQRERVSQLNQDIVDVVSLLVDLVVEGNEGDGSQKTKQISEEMKRIVKEISEVSLILSTIRVTKYMNLKNK